MDDVVHQSQANLVRALARIADQMGAARLERFNGADRNSAFTAPITHIRFGHAKVYSSAHMGLLGAVDPRALPPGPFSVL